jgi:hypothetical protein
MPRYKPFGATSNSNHRVLDAGKRRARSLLSPRARRLPSRVEEGRGIRIEDIEASRFPSPLIKPDVRVSRIRLADWLHFTAHGGGPIWTCRRRSTPNVPKTASLLKRLVPRVGTL